ncbi:glycoside hydrolase family 13 protein [Cercospora zeae-maydis SCOH1-5]|uniref:alpha-amylase n=1 Tax=Cercospora zeae-maydis SCOH1-5 TaxID=717836 RepID=A0A6A6FL00_9PEZI|nr:glycoside hydrolase family 13 protein [Cercospora zeae-maydis SCOH1-5]
MRSSSPLSLFVVALIAIATVGASGATLDDWRSRTIYQVITDRFSRTDGSTTAPCDVVNGRYCGGSWKGITNKLDYIQGMNFDAIWISPVVEQLPQVTIDGDAHMGYWAQDLYNLNSNFGTADDLHELIAEVHRRGMYLMLDIVVNHMAYAGPASQVDYGVFHPFNDEKYFHTYCPIQDYTNETQVEVCWLGSSAVSLADLRTEDRDVRDMWSTWITQMVANYSIDGLRIDTAVNVEPDFFARFVRTAGVFATGETMFGDNSMVCRWADSIGSILNYPIYYPLMRAFGSTTGNLNDLVTTIYTTRANCEDTTTFGTFSENHDVARFTELTNDTAQAKNVLAFTIMFDGIPIVYQGQEQHMAGTISPHTNRSPLWSTGFDTDAELYKHISTLVLARKHFVLAEENYTQSETDVIYQDYHSMVLRKGVNDTQVLTVLNNAGESTGDFEIDILAHGLAFGTQVMEVLTCTNLTVNNTGVLKVPMGKGLPKVMYPTKFMANSGLCGMGEPLPKPTATVTTSPPAPPTSTTSSEPDHSGANGYLA